MSGFLASWAKAGLSHAAPGEQRLHYLGQCNHESPASRAGPVRKGRTGSSRLAVPFQIIQAAFQFSQELLSVNGFSAVE
jgi:hypothetical protein